MMKLENSDLGERKFQIEDKLEKELNKLKVIRENVAKSNQITTGMVNILSSFEHRLARLEETILPVYNETENLQRRQQNIEKALTSLDNVISYYSIAEEVDGTVRAGPGSSTLDDYINVLNKVKQALNYFEKNNPQSVELENVSSCFNIGIDLLCREFRETLLKHSRSIPPITLIDLVTTDDVSGDDISVGSFGGMSESVTADLATMCSWLLAQGNQQVLEIYHRARSDSMLKSVKHLVDQEKSNSGHHSPSMRPKFQSRHDTSGRSASKRLQAVLEKKANKMLLKASQTLESSTGLTLGSRRSGGFNFENREDIVDEQEMESYLMCVIAVQKLMSLERNLMGNIVPASHHHKVFQSIIQESLDTIVHDGENIASRAKRSIGRHEFGSILMILAILKNLAAIKPEFEKAVEGCDYNIRSQFNSILNTLHTTVAKGLEEVVESLRNDSSSGLPKDGTVAELTSNMLVLLCNLADYKETIETVLSKPHGSSQNHLAVYIKKVLSQLNCTLISKSEGYSEPGVKAIFRLNNCHHVLKALQRSSLLALVTICEPDCEQTYLDMITAHKKAYQLSWNKVLSYIVPIDDGVITSGRMKDKDRGIIKERFAGFNKEVEEISKLQRTYSIPDVELRESLKRDNKEYILPKYNAFYDKFSNVPFTKNPEKYVKYTPDQVASLIDRFFDLAA
ncbi:exocyst complex component 7 [Cimex lectularius]|uniref:Exocyst complex component 7 n=1 Tax=Cimex lectularius TaxID=79782 RepID=A0A8I6RUS6_CIMLE|nr:exocyst complex component 7 [Cimex lectularius]